MKLWIIVIKDKDLPDEPDVAFAIIEGNAGAAEICRRELVEKLTADQPHRYRGRVSELERGRLYPLVPKGTRDPNRGIRSPARFPLTAAQVKTMDNIKKHVLRRKDDQ